MAGNAVNIIFYFARIDRYRHGAADNSSHKTSTELNPARITRSPAIVNINDSYCERINRFNNHRAFAPAPEAYFSRINGAHFESVNETRYYNINKLSIDTCRRVILRRGCNNIFYCWKAPGSSGCVPRCDSFVDTIFSLSEECKSGAWVMRASGFMGK